MIGVVFALLMTAVLVTLMAPFRTELGLVNAGFVFLLVTLLIAATWGRQVGIFAAVISNIAFNFFFLEPLHTFSVQEPRNIVALLLFLAVSVVGGTLLAAARTAELEARRVARRWCRGRGRPRRRPH